MKRNVPDESGVAHLKRVLRGLAFALLLGPIAQTVSPTTIEFSGVTTFFRLTETTDGVADAKLFPGLDLPNGTPFAGTISWAPFPQAFPPEWSISVGGLTVTSYGGSPDWMFDGVLFGLPETGTRLSYHGANLFYGGNLIQAPVGSLELELTQGGAADVGVSNLLLNHFFQLFWVGRITASGHRVPESGSSALLLALSLLPMSWLAARSTCGRRT